MHTLPDGRVRHYQHVVGGCWNRHRTSARLHQLCSSSAARRTLGGGGLIVFQTKRTASFLEPGVVVAKLPWSLAPWTAAAAAVVGSPTLDTPPRARYGLRQRALLLLLSVLWFPSFGRQDVLAGGDLYFLRRMRSVVIFSVLFCASLSLLLLLLLLYFCTFRRH